MNKLKRTAAVVALLVMILVSSCHSSRTAVDKKSATPGARLEWHEMSVPVTFSLTYPKSISIGGTMTMVKGVSTTVSLRFFGMEMGALHLTADSLKAYSKLQRIYVAEDLTAALGGLNLPLEQVQALLIGQESDDFTRLPKLAGQGSKLAIEAKASDATGRPESLSVLHKSSGRLFKADWVADEAMPLATRLVMSLSKGASGNSQGTMQTGGSLIYTWDKAVIDKPNRQRPFTIPSNYRRVDGKSLLNSFTSL